VPATCLQSPAVNAPAAQPRAAGAFQMLITWQNPMVYSCNDVCSATHAVYASCRLMTLMLLRCWTALASRWSPACSSGRAASCCGSTAASTSWSRTWARGCCTLGTGGRGLARLVGVGWGGCGVLYFGDRCVRLRLASWCGVSSGPHY
jgi:hypothetical protein